MDSEEISFKAYLAVLLKKFETLLREGVQSEDSCMVMAAVESVGWFSLGIIVSQVFPMLGAAFWLLALLRGSYWLWRAEKML